MRPQVSERLLDGDAVEARPGARIGPNAITRLGEAVRDAFGPAAEQRLFLRAGLARYLGQPPDDMVDEAEVMALHRALRHSYPGADVRRIADDAGRRTGDYLLANRIPRGAQRILRLLPRRLASRVLAGAVARHAWTFAGSGTFRIVATYPLQVTIEDSPICRGETSDEALCGYYAATFSRIFQVLVDPRWRIVETHCSACGGGSCRFEAITARDDCD